LSIDSNLCEIVDRLLAGPAARHLSIRRVAAGQLICGSKDDAELSVFVVRSGVVRCFVSFEGKELSLFMLNRGDAIQLHGGSMLEVKKAGEIVTIGMTAFQTLIRTEPELAASVLPILDRQLQQTIRMVEDMAFHGVRHRLIRALCDAAERDGRRAEQGIVIDAALRGEDFSMQIGATRQSVSTVIAELIRSGILQRFGTTTMVISDLGRLRQQLAMEGR
jgi:CRP-like cAMP-binding protein